MRSGLVSLLVVSVALVIVVAGCNTRDPTLPSAPEAGDDDALAYGGNIQSLGQLPSDDAGAPAQTSAVTNNGNPEDLEDPDVAADASETAAAAAMATAPATAPPNVPPFDAGPGGVCDAALGPGDLMIDEFMIESVTGTGDHGEWLEVASTLDCAVDLIGLRGECPRGAKTTTFVVTSDSWIPARGTFVVADATDPAVNHYLPGTVVAWSGNLGDVLRNEGTTVTLLQGSTIVDTLTYPSLKLTVGASLAFPADCVPSARSDWTLWQTSTASWFPGFEGTPNAPNVDISCPNDADL